MPSGLGLLKLSIFTSFFDPNHLLSKTDKMCHFNDEYIWIIENSFLC